MHIGRVRFGEARIAWSDAGATASVEPGMWQQLGEKQTRRHAALGGLHAQRFSADRALLALLIAELTDIEELGFTTTCERCGADHGRPRLENAPVALSVSYAGSMVAVAAAPIPAVLSVGVDIESRPPDGAAAPLHELTNLFGATRVPDTARWTLLEAAAKADGRGIRIDLASIDIGEPSTGRFPGSRAVHLPGEAAPMDAAVLDGPEGFVLSAAVSFGQTPR